MASTFILSFSAQGAGGGQHLPEHQESDLRVPNGDDLTHLSTGCHIHPGDLSCDFP